MTVWLFFRIGAVIEPDLGLSIADCALVSQSVVPKRLTVVGSGLAPMV